MKKLMFTFLLVSTLFPLSAQWTYHPYKDPMTDADESSIINITPAGQAIAFKRNGTADPDFVVVWNKFFAGDRDRDVLVTYRIDNHPAVGPRYWRMGAGSNTLAFMPDNQRADFRRRLLTAQTVTFRVTDPVDGETLTFSFTVGNLAQQLQRLR